MTLGGWIFLAILALVVGFAVVTYNRLVGLRQRSQAAWSDIDVQLKRRTDLVPNLVETVKGYAAHERTTLDQVIRARGAALGVVLILAGGALFAGRGGFDGAGWPVGVGVVASGLIVFGIGQAMPRRTWRGARLLVHVRGFREFLERAEKDRLERLPADTLHRWLPWAVALGVSQQWIRRFRGLRVDAPSWYRGRQPFTLSDYEDGVQRFSRGVGEALDAGRQGRSGGSGGSGFSGGSPGGGRGGGGGGTF